MYRKIAVILAVFLLSLPSFARNSIQENSNASVYLKMSNGSYVNGMIADCIGNKCLILTVAHGCNPYQTAKAFTIGILTGEIKYEQAIKVIDLYEIIIKNSLLCHGIVSFDDQDVAYSARPIAINFTHDLLALEANIPIKVQKDFNIIGSVKVSTHNPTPSQELYSIVIWGQEATKTITYSRAGFTLSSYVWSLSAKPYDLEMTQTSFMVNKGSSGSPVYDLETHKLLGLISLKEGTNESPVVVVQMVTTKHTSRFFAKAKKMFRGKNDSKSNWPDCIGEKQLCQMVHGEISEFQIFRHFLNEARNSADPQGDLEFEP